MTGVLLQIDGLRKRFGGLTATDDLTLDIRTGELHALIGPNGAGKTTLVSQIMGELNPDAGTIALQGHNLVHLGSAARVRHGLARTFQIVQLLPQSTARDNVVRAVLYMASLPLDANVLSLTVMATKMPFVGRG